MKAPDRLARRLSILLDGAFSVMMIHHDPDYVREAGDAALEMIRSGR